VETQRRASIPEIIGAWLRIWTPPRDAYVPPVPWRKLALGAAAGAVVIGIALAILVPRINTGKAERAAALREQERRAEVRNRARINRLQRPHHGDASKLLPAADASAVEQEIARARVLDQVEESIEADAEARSAAGEMRDVTGPTTCEHTPGRPTDGPRVAFDCFTVARKIKPGKQSPGVIGYPFRAIIDYRDFSYTWCKVEQTPGELMIQDPTKVVHLPEECEAPRA
jgi:hypothetical protein